MFSGIDVRMGTEERQAAPRRLVVMGAAVMLLAGCQSPSPMPTPVTPSASVQRLVIGHSTQNRPIEAWVMGDGDDVVLILATIHGNESAGTPLVERLREYLMQRPHYLRGRTVVLVPVANPDGLAASHRHNARGVDLNRNFPAGNRVDRASHGTELSEPEARALHELIARFPPHRVVSIHQPIRVIDYDGPGESLALMMARHCDLPVRKLGARPGSLGSYVGVTLGRPIITVEFARDADDLTHDELWRRYGRMLLAAITYPVDVAQYDAPLMQVGQ